MRPLLYLILLLPVTGCVTSTTARTPVTVAFAFQANEMLAQRLSENGQKRLALAERTALDVGLSTDPVQWQTGENERGSVTASQPFRVGRRECRRISHAVERLGDALSADATVCRVGQGAWSRIS